jgi:hypothetical protein
MTDGWETGQLMHTEKYQKYHKWRSRETIGLKVEDMTRG